MTEAVIQIGVWELVGALAGVVTMFITVVWGLGKLLIRQIEKRLDERYRAQEQARMEAQKRWDNEFRRIEEHSRSVERDLQHMKVMLPNEYVKREDWIRFSGTIDKKLDDLHKLFRSLLEKISQRFSKEFTDA